MIIENVCLCVYLRSMVGFLCFEINLYICIRYLILLKNLLVCKRNNDWVCVLKYYVYRLINIF